MASAATGTGGDGDDGDDRRGEKRKLDSIDINGRALRHKEARAQKKFRYGKRRGTRSHTRVEETRSRERSPSPERQPECPSRVDGTEIWMGGRLSWQEPAKGNWKAAQADALGNYTCAYATTPRAHVNCKGTSNVAANYQVDHDEDWKNYVVGNTTPRIVCDGIWHWLAIHKDEATDAYNDQANFLLLCDSCNASKGRSGAALDYGMADKLGPCDCED